MPKGKPIPAKFEDDQEKLLKWVAAKSGLTVSEVIRRAVFLLNSEVQRRNGRVAWILEELTPEHAAGPMPRAERGLYDDGIAHEGLLAAESNPPPKAQAKRAHR
jgi:hypothetical protein